MCSLINDHSVKEARVEVLCLKLTGVLSSRTLTAAEAQMEGVGRVFLGGQTETVLAAVKRAGLDVFTSRSDCTASAPFTHKHNILHQLPEMITTT